MTRRRRRRFERVGELVPRVLDDLGIGGAARIVQVASGWESAVGADVAAHATPVQFREDVLEVEVDSSVWCQQLKLQEPQLIAALARELGDAAPKALRLRVR